MSERLLHGLGAAPGVAVGRALLLRDMDDDPAGAHNGDEAGRALAALAHAVEELERAAARLRAAGLGDEAEIVATSVLMAQDPALVAAIRSRAGRMPAARAVGEAAEEHAAALAALDDPLLAARAADVRELGRRTARILAGAASLGVRREDDGVLVARDLGPGEMAELELGGGIVGVALAEGAATSHAAIIARSLGVPMAVGLGPAVFDVVDGEQLIVDGSLGSVVVAPGRATLAAALGERGRSDARRQRLARQRGLPAETRDGHRVCLLCNAAGAADVEAGLAAGADGVGLLRTELAFLDAPGWPTEAEHRRSLEPALALLRGRVATVRTLDYGADKTPPFLAGVRERGLQLALAAPDALAAQIRAIVEAGAHTELRLLLPLVASAEELRRVRALLADALPVGAEAPALGAMIETPAAVARAGEIAGEADFLSIGTNDLVATTLVLDRELPLASVRTAADPRVLRNVAAVVAAARDAGRTVEVCGEAASDPALAALFVGLGVDELSVAPARLDEVRASIRGVTLTDAREAAEAALRAHSAEEALALADALLLAAQVSDPQTRIRAAQDP